MREGTQAAQYELRLALATAVGAHTTMHDKGALCGVVNGAGEGCQAVLKQLLASAYVPTLILRHSTYKLLPLIDHL